MQLELLPSIWYNYVKTKWNLSSIVFEKPLKNEKKSINLLSIWKFEENGWLPHQWVEVGDLRK